MNISQIIAQKRKEAKLTAKELAERSGLSAAFISRIESGDYESVSLPTVKALAEGLGLTLHALLEAMNLLNHTERPSYKLISQSLRQLGYSDAEAVDVIRYARYLKERNRH
jgi:transcriptional regulator with XRE-family HTH domain